MPEIKRESDANNNIFKLYGMLVSIVCDRESAFTSAFYKELFRLQGISFNFSRAYHSQTDGQIKVVNRILEPNLRCFTNLKQKAWAQWLSWVGFFYNQEFSAEWLSFNHQDESI